jgi:hypothetical protein
VTIRTAVRRGRLSHLEARRAQRQAIELMFDAWDRNGVTRRIVRNWDGQRVPLWRDHPEDRARRRGWSCPIAARARGLAVIARLPAHVHRPLAGYMVDVDSSSLRAIRRRPIVDVVPSL